jgi:hypothetical protein
MEPQHHLHPRSKRISTESKILYSETDSLHWHAGLMKNVSSSGLLFEGKYRIPPGKCIEMTFTVPLDVLGVLEQGAAEQVYCTGVIVRIDAGSESGERVARMGASITSWHRLPAGEVSDEH